MASLPILEVLLLYFGGYYWSFKCEKHRWNVLRQEVAFVANILRWNFHTRLLGLALNVKHFPKSS